MKKSALRTVALGLASVLAVAACGTDDEDADPATTESISKSSTTTASTVGSETTEATAADTTDVVDTTAESVAPDTSPATSEPVPATGEPIKVGSINTEAGAIQLIGGSQGAQIYLDQLNAAGGYEGRPFELVTASAGLDPAEVASAARDLIEREGVVAILGSSSPIDCTVNGAFYESSGVASIGPIFEPSCFTSDHLFPVGPASQVAMNACIAADIEALGVERVAVLTADVPGAQELIDSAAATISAAGAEMVVSEIVGLGLPPTQIARAAELDVDMIVLQIDPGAFTPALTSAQQQGIGPADGVNWLVSQGFYSAQSAPLLTDGVRACTNFAPFDAEFPEALELQAAFEDRYPDSALDASVSQGWLAATVLDAALDQMSGEFSAAALLEAINSLTSVDTTIQASALDYTNVPREIASTGIVMEFRDGGFVVASDGWQTVG